MTEHYYSSQPSARQDRKLIEVALRGRVFRFLTDAGVFSKHGIDYGSRFLIDTMQIPEEACVLDVGCGYGPIGLSAAVLASKGTVWMVDVNERAIFLSVENAKINDISNVNIIRSDLFSEISKQAFSHVLTNPPIRAGKETVHRIFEGAFNQLLPDGELWVVIQKKQGAPSAKEKLECLFPFVEEVGKDKGYRIFKAKKEK